MAVQRHIGAKVHPPPCGHFDAMNFRQPNFSRVGKIFPVSPIVHTRFSVRIVFRHRLDHFLYLFPAANEGTVEYHSLCQEWALTWHSHVLPRQHCVLPRHQGDSPTRTRHLYRNLYRNLNRNLNRNEGEGDDLACRCGVHIFVWTTLACRE